MRTKTAVLLLRLLEEELAATINKQARCSELLEETERADDVVLMHMKWDYERHRIDVEEAIERLKEEWL